MSFAKFKNIPYAVSGLKYAGIFVEGPILVGNIRLKGTGSVS